MQPADPDSQRIRGMTIEIVLLLLVFFLYAGLPAPDVNEVNEVNRNMTRNPNHIAGNTLLLKNVVLDVSFFISFQLFLVNVGNSCQCK